MDRQGCGIDPLEEYQHAMDHFHDGQSGTVISCSYAYPRDCQRLHRLASIS